MFATLDPEENSSNNVEKPEELTPNDIIEKISANPAYQEQFARLKESQLVNNEIAQEIYGILQEIDNQLYDTAGGHKYINWETDPIPYGVLRRAGESEVARLIKNKRRLDFMQYASPPAQTGGVERGVKLVFTNPLYQPSKEEKALLSEWETKIFSQIFFPPNETKPNFGKFIGAAYEDFFDLDDITLETRVNGLGDPVAIHLQDPIIYKPIIKPRKYDTAIYRDDVTELLNNYEKLYGEPAFTESMQQDDPDYLLVYQNQLFAAVTRDRVRKHHFFVRSDFRRTQRGYSIVEQAVRLTTWIMNGIRMNAGNFSTKLPEGFFAFTGGVAPMQLEKLKKIMYAYQTGASNQNRMPMISLHGVGNEKPDAKWVGVRNTNREMEYHQFMTLLFSIYCQLSGTDPREVSLGDYGDAIGKRSLFDEPSDGLVKESKDQGAKTFLTHLADSLNEGDRYNRNIFQRLTKLDVKMKFLGFEVEDRQKKLEIQTKELSTTKSINDLLAEQDVPKQTLMLNDINVYDLKGISNQQLFQVLTLKNQQTMQQQAQPPMGSDPAAQGPQGEEEAPGAGQLTDKDKQLISKYKDSAQMDEELQGELE
ncbi:MAG TPA: hypothetical protein VHO03_16810 [Ignavibacteriales bacterium]|nr:hypothetical protein [Ignavibacteriales bacterium]